jgi:hypothetical protein
VRLWRFLHRAVQIASLLPSIPRSRSIFLFYDKWGSGSPFSPSRVFHGWPETTVVTEMCHFWFPGSRWATSWWFTLKALPSEQEKPYATTSVASDTVGKPHSPTKGVKEDISKLTQTLTIQLRGIASFLAPPQQSQSEFRTVSQCFIQATKNHTPAASENSQLLHTFFTRCYETFCWLCCQFPTMIM